MTREDRVREVLLNFLLNCPVCEQEPLRPLNSQNIPEKCKKAINYTLSQLNEIYKIDEKTVLKAISQLCDTDTLECDFEGLAHAITQKLRG